MYSRGDLEVCAAVSDEQTLREVLGLSPDIVSGELGMRTFIGYANAAEALNAALDSSSAKVVILPHQDVYLPRHFLRQLCEQIEALEKVDPDWAVLGCIGVDADGVVHGETWSSGMAKVVGSPISSAVKVVSVDEMILVVRSASSARFDPGLPGFHLYGTEILVSAADDGRASYVIPMPVVHHSRRLVKLGGDYWRAYLYLRRKWSDRLPVPTLFGGISRSLKTLAAIDLDYRIRNRGRSTRPAPGSDPVSIARRLGYET